MDQPITRGTYIEVGTATYLVVQHDALAELPTLVALPSTTMPLPHRPPLIVRDNTYDLWIHAFAPATLLRTDITTVIGTAPVETLTEVDTALGAILDLETLPTSTNVYS